MAEDRDDELSERLKDFRVWGRKPKDQLVIPAKNRYGNRAYFEDHEGVILIAFGTDDGFEPDKDALKFDKKDLPEVIAFLQKALEG